MNFENVYALCNKMGYFTYGSSHAYSRMFELVNAHAPVEIIAAVIWSNSDEDAQLDQITAQLNRLS